MARELMPKSGIMMPYVVVTRDAAVVGVSTVDGVAGEINLTNKYLQITDAANTYLNKTDGATKTFVMDAISPIMEGALFKADPYVANDVPFRSAGANGVESVEMIKVDTSNRIKVGSYESNVQGVEFHSTGNLNVVDLNVSGVETRYPVYTARHRPPISDLPFAAIGSYVTDSQGRTIGVNRTGINSDIKQLTQKVVFTQPPTVPDGVSDYDPVNVRQLRNAGGGSGPSLNGVMNFGVGHATLWQSRAFIPSYCVPADGQLLNRDDWPDLWAFAQANTPISDSDWISNPGKRSNYSSGDGSTTFRVPDKNGVQANSIPGLFGRGDQGGSLPAGNVYESAAPNLSGRIGAVSAEARGIISSGTGAFSVRESDLIVGFTTPSATGTPNRYSYTYFDAQSNNPVYGRSANQVWPNSFVGVWIIRASGGFTATDTLWSVKNADDTLPAPGTVVQGGLIQSVYDTADSGNEIRGELQVGQVVGDSLAYTAIRAVKGANTGQFQVASDGSVQMQNGANFNTTASNGSVNFTGTWRPTAIETTRTDGAPGVTVKGGEITSGVSRNDLQISSAVAATATGNFVNLMTGRWYNGYYQFGGIRSSGTTLAHVQLNVSADGSSAANYQFGTDGIARAAQWQNTSDRRLKKNIETISDPLKVMKEMRGYKWEFDPYGTYGFGFIADEVEKHFPEAVSETDHDVTLSDGTVIDNVKSVDTYGVAAALHHEAILELMKEIENLKAEVAELKAQK